MPFLRVESGVSHLQQGCCLAAVFRRGGDPDGYFRVRGLASSAFADELADATGDHLCFGMARIRQYRNELISSVPPKVVSFAQKAAHGARHPGKRAVARAVAIVIVDELEMMQIHRQHAQRFMAYLE